MKTGKIMVFIVLLSACSSQPDNNVKEKFPSYQQLSTENQPNLQQADEPLDENFNVHEIEPPIKHENLEQDPLQESIPKEEEQTEVIPKLNLEPKNIEKKETPKIPMLPFQDFKERWNAITDEQMSNLYIRNLTEKSNEDGMYYLAQLNKHIELKIYIFEKSIIQLEMITNDKSQATIFTMLSGWSHIITILHQNREIPDVDTLFNKIGVGPNGNLSTLKTGPIVYFDMVYEIIPTDHGYTLQAARSQKNS